MSRLNVFSVRNIKNQWFQVVTGDGSYTKRRISTEIFNRLEKIVDEVSESFSPPGEGVPLDNLSAHHPSPTVLHPSSMGYSWYSRLLPITVIM